MPIATSAYLSVGVFFLLPLLAPLLPLAGGGKKKKEKERKKKKPRRPRETAVAAVENVRTRQRKQTGRQLSVFLCEVIMCSPRCFCSHANEVDRVGNHFQILNRGKK